MSGLLEPPTKAQHAEPMRLVGGLFAGRARGMLRAAAHEGALRVVESQDLFAPAALPRLASLSVWLFLLGGLGFAALDIVALRTHPHIALFAGLPFVVWLVVIVLANILTYLAMVPIHEGIHAAVILALGGRPHFGLKLPYAAYTTAPGQVFPPRAYEIVALAPLVVLTIAGIVLTWLVPVSGVLLWLFWVGNFSGAAGDLVVARAVGRLPRLALIADTATGYTAYVPSEEG